MIFCFRGRFLVSGMYKILFLASNITFHIKKYDQCSSWDCCPKCVRCSRHYTLDITLNGSLNLLYVTRIMMIKCLRIIGSGTYLAHITFSLATQSQTQYTSRQSLVWWHMRGHLYMGERLGGGVLLIRSSFANEQISSDRILIRKVY